MSCKPQPTTCLDAAAQIDQADLNRIYPLGAFQSKSWNGFQGDYQLVYHQ
jgi:hypothetical protein